MFGLLTPSETINYNFVAGVYGAFAVLSIVLLVAQRFTSAVDGFYIVFAPFLPCFLWSLLVRQRWLAVRSADKSDAAIKKDQ
jgi:hypothetical protein